jgi:hypothetical protein
LIEAHEITEKTEEGAEKRITCYFFLQIFICVPIDLNTMFPSIFYKFILCLSTDRMCAYWIPASLQFRPSVIKDSKLILEVWRNEAKW